MEISKMHHISDSLLTAITSMTALIFSQISINIQDDTTMKSITVISSIVLCITAIVKLIDLCMEKFPKWKVAFNKRFRKNKHES